MKKILLFISLFVLCFNVYASSGSIKQSSVIECDGILYGSHSDHWHVVKYENGKYIISSSKEFSAPSCYTELENESEIVSLSKCVDGDTAKFLLSDGSIKTARFLAIDTPESVHPNKDVEEYGVEASDYTCNLLTNAKEIKIEYDKASDKTDKYGRILVWVYTDGKMVQETLLEQGLAKVAYLYANYEYTSSLQNIENIAKNKKIGIWSDYEEETDSSSVSSNMNETENDLENDTSTYESFFEKIFLNLKNYILYLLKEIIKKI